MHGALGFSTGIPSIVRHLWAERSGYVLGPGFAGSGSGVLSVLTWLGSLCIEVSEPMPSVCVGSNVATM